MLPLLLASKISNEAASTGVFDRISISFPKCEGDNYVLKPNPKFDIKYLEGPDPKSYIWIRPTKDILAVPLVSFVMLFQNGGSMNISKITHLAALTELHIENEVSARYWTRNRNLCKWIFTIAEKHCPALKKLSLIIGLDVTQTSDSDEDHEQDKRSIIIDIDDDFYKLDFRDDRHEDSRVVDAEGRSHLDELFDQDYCRYTSRKLHKAYTVLREYLNDYKDNESKARYWKKFKVVPTLRARVNSMAGNT